MLMVLLFQNYSSIICQALKYTSTIEPMMLAVGLSRSTDGCEALVGERTGGRTGTGPAGYSSDAPQTTDMRA